MSDPALMHYRVEVRAGRAGSAGSHPIVALLDIGGTAVRLFDAADIAAAEKLNTAIVDDLLRIDVDAFRAKYQLDAPPTLPAAGTLVKPNPNGAWRNYRLEHIRRKVVGKRTTMDGKKFTFRRKIQLTPERLQRLPGDLGKEISEDVTQELTEDLDAVRSVLPGAPIRKVSNLGDEWKPTKGVGSGEGDVVRIVDHDGNIVATLPATEETAAAIAKIAHDLFHLEATAFRAKYRIPD
jgi:hypothetical protein